MIPEIELRIKLIGELCKYYFSYKFTKAGWIYSPCEAVCRVVFKTILIMKNHGLIAREIACKLDSYLIPNILVDRGWVDTDITVLLAAPDLQTYLIWEDYMKEGQDG